MKVFIVVIVVLIGLPLLLAVQRWGFRPKGQFWRRKPIR